jgi:hypothetical protein
MNAHKWSGHRGALVMVGLGGGDASAGVPGVAGLTLVCDLSRDLHHIRVAQVVSAPHGQPAGDRGV